MARNGFGIFSTQTPGGYVAGWCPHCGRRRGTDGRCNDCDPWYTSPLVQYGGPVVALFTVFLIAGAIILNGRGADAADGAGANAGAVLAAPTYAAAPFNQATYRPAPVSAFAAMPKPPDPASLTARFTPRTFSPEQRQYEELESLRQMTAYVDAQVNADRLRREQESHRQTANFRLGHAMLETADGAEYTSGVPSAL